MTKEELQECRSLIREAEELRGMIVELEERRERGQWTAFSESVYDRRMAQLQEAERHVTEAVERIEAAIDCLPSVERRLIRLRYIEGWSWQKIAQTLHFSESVVRQQIQGRALDRLKFIV